MYYYIKTVVKKGRKRLKLVCKATKLNTPFFQQLLCFRDQNRIIKTKLFTQIGSFISINCFQRRRTNTYSKH